MALGPELVLFAAVHKDDIPCIHATQTLWRRLLRGDKPYIGLRERAEDAVERAEYFTKDTHKILKIIFTTAGIAHFATSTADAAHNFAPLLSKHTYKDATDWKVWHYIGDLNVNSYDSRGVQLTRAEVCEVP